MRRSVGLLAAIAFQVTWLVSAPVHAIEFISGYGNGTCVSGTVTASSSAMTFQADYCIGRIKGNDAASGGDPLMSLLEGGVFGDHDWTFFGKSDDPNSDIGATHDVTSGTWWLHPGLSISGPFVISFKHGNGWSAYFFESVANVRYGTFTLPWLKNGKDLALSHVSLFVGNSVPPIPLPATILLFLAGLAALPLARRRRS
ncbi:MAG: hypothetical protein Kow00104_10070 [Rhodothalassiaceae bacterium]